MPWSYPLPYATLEASPPTYPQTSAIHFVFVPLGSTQLPGSRWFVDLQAECRELERKGLPRGGGGTAYLGSGEVFELGLGGERAATLGGLKPTSSPIRRLPSSRS